MTEGTIANEDGHARHNAPMKRLKVAQDKMQARRTTECGLLIVHTGEKAFFAARPNVLTFDVMGNGFTWDTQDRARNMAAARAASERSKILIKDPGCDFIILDGLSIVLRDDTLPTAEIIEFLTARPFAKHICMTGRAARPELIEIADLVTEVADVKHPFKAGFMAQKGVEH